MKKDKHKLVVESLLAAKNMNAEYLELSFIVPLDLSIFKDKKVIYYYDTDALKR